jgi:hypothetical protein
MLQNTLSDQAETAKPGRGSKEVALVWSGNTRVLLRAGRYDFTFHVSSRDALNPDSKDVLFYDRVTMKTSDERQVKLPAPPIKMGDRLYVPLAPVARAMRGTLNVNSASHRLSFRVPPFWNTAIPAATG